MDDPDIQVVAGPTAGRLWPGGDPAWADFGVEERQAIVMLVRDSLQLLLGDIEGWLPEHVELHAPSKVALRIMWDLSSVDAEILKLRTAAEVQEHETIRQLQHLARPLTN